MCPWAGNKRHTILRFFWNKKTIRYHLLLLKALLAFFSWVFNQLSWRKQLTVAALAWRWIGVHQMSSALWWKYIYLSILFLFFNLLTWWRRGFGRRCRPLTWNNPQYTKIQGRQIIERRDEKDTKSPFFTRPQMKGEEKNSPNEFLGFDSMPAGTCQMEEILFLLLVFGLNYLFYFWQMWRERRQWPSF